MHNWHLLLFAFLAFLQPIVCFSKRSLVDGREQCCDRNTLLRDTRLSYGTSHFQLPSEDHRLNNRAQIREDRRYEVRKDDSVITRFSINRRLVDIPSERQASRNSREVAARLTRTENQRVRLTNYQRERSLSALESRVQFSPHTRRIASRDTSHDERIRDIVREHYSRDFGTRLYERDSRDFKRLSRDGSNRMVRNSATEAKHPASYDSRPDNRRTREREVTNDIRRIQSRETRDLLQRTRADIARSEMSSGRREVREKMDKRQTFRLRSESRLQSDNNRQHRSLEREVPDRRDTRRWSLVSRSADRIRSFRQDMRSRLREHERQRVDSRKVLGEKFSDRRQTREESREVRDRMTSARRESHERNAGIRQVSRERTSEERYSRGSEDRVRNIENRVMRLERVVNRRDSRGDERVARVYNRENRAASENRRLESRRAMDRETQQQDNVFNRRDRRSTDRIDIRDMKREVHSRSTETRERGTTHIEQRMTKNNVERRTVRESFASMVGENKPAEQTAGLNWQYLFYTLQGVYLCSLLIQMSENGSKKKSRSSFWWLANQSVVKMD